MAPPQWPRKPVWQQAKPARHSNEFEQGEPLPLPVTFRAAPIAEFAIGGAVEDGTATALSSADALEPGDEDALLALGRGPPATPKLAVGSAPLVTESSARSGAVCGREQAHVNSIKTVRA